MSLLLSHLLLCLSLLILFSHIFHPILSHFCPTLCLFVFPSCLLFFSLSDCSRPVLSFLSLISFSSHLSSVFFFSLNRLILNAHHNSILFFCLLFVFRLIIMSLSRLFSSRFSLVLPHIVSCPSCLLSSF